MAKRGKDFENLFPEMVEILGGLGYKAEKSKSIKMYANHRPWQVDLMISKGKQRIVIELKQQQSGGSTYEKVDFGCRKLTKVATRTKAKKAMVVYTGCKMERFLNSHPLAQEMKRDYSNIEFISAGDFMLRLRAGDLF